MFIVGIGSAAIAPVVISYIVGEFPPDKTSGGFSLYMLISSAAVIFGPTAAALSLVILIWVERKAKTPILQGSFMKRRSFVLSIAALF